MQALGCGGGLLAIGLWIVLPRGYDFLGVGAVFVLIGVLELVLDAKPRPPVRDRTQSRDKPESGG